MSFKQRQNPHPPEINVLKDTGFTIEIKYFQYFMYSTYVNYLIYILYQIRTWQIKAIKRFEEGRGLFREIIRQAVTITMTEVSRDAEDVTGPLYDIKWPLTR